MQSRLHHNFTGNLTDSLNIIPLNLYENSIYSKKWSIQGKFIVLANFIIVAYLC